MDFDSILKEMEKERQKAFEIKKKESSKDKEKHEDEHENVQEEDEDRKDDTSKEDEEERTEDEDSEHEEVEEEKEENFKHEENDDEVKEESSDEDTEKEEEIKEEREETEHDESEEQGESEEKDNEEVEENKEEVVKEETETKVETLENVTEKTKTSKTSQPLISSIKPKLQSIKLNSTQTKSIIKQNKQKDVIKMPKKINIPKKTKIIKTTKIKRIITQPATSVKKIKVTTIGASAPAEIKRLAKDVAKLKEGLDKLLKQQKENNALILRKQKEKEIETIRKNKEKEIEAAKRDKEKEASALKRHAELKNEMNKSAKKEDLSKESQILANEVDKVRKDIAYLKEFQPEILFSSIQKLNENITEMNSLFRLAAELMQKPDPVQSKLKKLFDENEKIAQGILTVLDAVNEIKQFGTREVEDIRRIEEEIRLPLKEIASRKQTDDMDAPSIPAPPPEFRETSSGEDSFGSFDTSREINEKNKSPFEAEDTELPLPPEMTPIPTSTGAPIPPESFQSFGQQAQSSAIRPAQPSQFGSGRALTTNRSSAFSNELPPSPTEFTQEQLDQLASMVPPLPRPTIVQFPPQRMQQQPQTQFQARQQPPQQRSSRFVRKKEELKM